MGKEIPWLKPLRRQEDIKFAQPDHSLCLKTIIQETAQSKKLFLDFQPKQLNIGWPSRSNYVLDHRPLGALFFFFFFFCQKTHSPPQECFLLELANKGILVLILWSLASAVTI